MPKDRREGPTLFWEFFWKFIYGERRSGQDRRRPVNQILFGCRGGCNQGRRPCDCKPSKERTEA